MQTRIPIQRWIKEIKSLLLHHTSPYRSSVIPHSHHEHIIVHNPSPICLLVLPLLLQVVHITISVVSYPNFDLHSLTQCIHKTYASHAHHSMHLFRIMLKMSLGINFWIQRQTNWITFQIYAELTSKKFQNRASIHQFS